MFEDFDPSEYEVEARERWGQTEAYQASARRAAGYGEREIADPRFAANYEKVATGLAMYGHEAVVANAGFAEPEPLERCAQPGAKPQSVIAMWPGWAATRASHSRTAG